MIRHRRYIAFVLLAFIAVVGFNFAQAQVPHSSPHPLLKSLTVMDAALDQTVKAIQGGKLEDMKLSVQDRKSIEDFRTRTIKSSELVRKQMEVLRRRQTLQGLFVLKSILDGFDRQLDRFSERIHRAELKQDTGASAKAAVDWLMAIERGADALEVATVGFDGEAFDLLTRANSALSSLGSDQ